MRLPGQSILYGRTAGRTVQPLEGEGMTAKEYLQQYGDAEQIAQRLKSEYDKQSELLITINSPQGSDGQPHGRGVTSPIENKAIKLAEKLTEYQEAELEAIRIRQRVLRTVNKVPGQRGAVLYEKYINLKSWRQVADTLHYSKRHCYNLHNEGLDIVEELIK